MKNPIGQAEISNFAEPRSYFGFELRILRLLKERGVDCEHGGTYRDPVTKKTRQFDIRGSLQEGEFELLMAVECKNIGEDFPVVGFCTPSVAEESFHEFLLSPNPQDYVHASDPFAL